MNYWYHFANHAKEMVIGLGIALFLGGVISVMGYVEGLGKYLRWLALVLAILSLACFVTSVACYAYVDANKPVPKSWFAWPPFPECPGK